MYKNLRLWHLILNKTAFTTNSHVLKFILTFHDFHVYTGWGLLKVWVRCQEINSYICFHNCCFNYVFMWWVVSSIYRKIHECYQCIPSTQLNSTQLNVIYLVITYKTSLTLTNWDKYIEVHSWSTYTNKFITGRPSLWY